MIYLDNAATTFPKPPETVREVYRCMTEYCGNPGRGSHYMAQRASEKIFEARSLLASMFGVNSPENVVFTLNTTHALNTSLKSFVREGMDILISDMEHNSVLRPVHALFKSGKVTYSVFSTDCSDDEVLLNIEKKIKHNTKILICQHTSNICGTVLPIKKIGELCKKRGIYFIADAAQSAGLFDIDVTDFGIDALCLPSHKGLYGPQGAGAILFSDKDFTSLLDTLTQGGSGTDSKDLEMPSYLPDRFEAGTLQTPVIAGLCEGIKFVLRNTPQGIRRHEEFLSNILKADMSSIKGVKLYRPEVPSSVVLFNVKGKSSVAVASELDKYGICVRGGFHCAPLAHRTLNTGDGGAVRISFGAFNDINEVKYTCEVIRRITREV